MSGKEYESMRNADLFQKATDELMYVAIEHEKVTGMKSQAFFEEVVKDELGRVGTDANTRVMEIAQEAKQAKSKRERQSLGWRIPVCYAVHAHKSAFIDDRAGALESLMDASYWRGVTEFDIVVSNKLRLQKQNAAKARHAEHRAIQAAVIEYYRRMNMNSAVLSTPHGRSPSESP